MPNDAEHMAWHGEAVRTALAIAAGNHYHTRRIAVVGRVLNRSQREAAQATASASLPLTNILTFRP